MPRPKRAASDDRCATRELDTPYDAAQDRQARRTRRLRRLRRHRRALPALRLRHASDRLGGHGRYDAIPLVAQRRRSAARAAGSARAYRHAPAEAGARGPTSGVTRYWLLVGRGRANTWAW